jgi:hypothetical protein
MPAPADRRSGRTRIGWTGSMALTALLSVC